MRADFDEEEGRVGGRRRGEVLELSVTGRDEEVAEEEEVVMVVVEEGSREEEEGEVSRVVAGPREGEKASG